MFYVKKIIIKIIFFKKLMQVLANFLATPLASGLDGDSVGQAYVAFDLDVSIVKVNDR